MKEELDRKNREESIEAEKEVSTKSFVEASTILKNKLSEINEKLHGLKDAEGSKSDMESGMTGLLRGLEEEVSCLPETAS